MFEFFKIDKKKELNILDTMNVFNYRSLGNDKNIDSSALFL
jgi:hypothetical protein